MPALAAAAPATPAASGCPETAVSQPFAPWRLRFAPRGDGDWTIDDVHVDPYRSR